MKTGLTRSPQQAAEFIRGGGIVAFPTETVYGLGANIFDLEAVAKIFRAKQRPADNPLIVHIADLGQIELLASTVSENAKKFVMQFFPGPLTIVVGKSANVPVLATAGLNTVGIRMPRNRVAREFLEACRTPVAAPSANLSGRPSPTTWQAVSEDLDGRIDCILQAEPTEIGIESTVVDCTGEAPILLRAGAISLEELQVIVPETRNRDQANSKTSLSPGIMHRHYSPAGKVYLIDRDETVDLPGSAGYIGIHDRPEHFRFKKVSESVESYAHELFEFLRDCDRQKIGTIFCQTVSEQGIGTALMDRLRRAAEE